MECETVFLDYKSELDGRHDRHERIVKLSRDTTIHSKRTIFLLHRAAAAERGSCEREEKLDEAESKLRSIEEFLKPIAAELHGLDHWLYQNAFSPGLQEFIEALSYYVFLRQGKLLSLEEAGHWLEYTRDEEGERLHVPLSPLNYVLGIADLTGELMRMCITSVGSGKADVPFRLLPFIDSIYCGFLGLPHLSRNLDHKLRVLRSSLSKIETASYNLHIRGCEIPKHMLAADVFQSAPSQDMDLAPCNTD